MTFILEIDNREPADYIKKLEEKYKVTVGAYDVSDYHVGNIIGIERKAMGDYLSSLYSGKLFQQATELKAQFENAVVLVEGDYETLVNVYGAEGKRAVMGSIASLFAHYHVPALFTGVGESFLDFLTLLVDKYTDGKVKTYSPIRRKPTKEERALFILSSLPSIDDVRAKKILEEYGGYWLDALNNIIDWTKIDGIGKKTVEKIKKAI
jgi:DNA excision repair protein ERCC-4